jgi:outer membrane protein assembly factor BamB
MNIQSVRRPLLRTVMAVIAVMAILPASPLLVQGQDRGIADFPKLSAETDWPWWRGPSRNGVAGGAPVPTKLSDSDNLIWKVPVPGRGHSSPIVVGNRVFLASADEKLKIHHVFSFDRSTGEPAWQVEVNKGGFPAKNHKNNTEASPTLASDGERLFGAFYHHDKVEAVALGLDGTIEWKQEVCPFRPRMFEYGYAPSPLVYGETVIISAEYDGNSFITALNRTTGKPVWKTARPTMISFSSPVIAHVAGKDQMLISGADQVASYDPKKGGPLWSTRGTSLATCGTMVWDGDIVFASGGYPKSETLAVKADGSANVLWRNNQKCYEQSMLAHDGHVYALTDNGVMFCWRGVDGKEMWKQRLTGPVSASPVLAGGHIYWANELGTLYVIRANPERFELVEQNQLGNESFPSPAICGGRIFLRVAERSATGRREILYCFGSK